MFDQERILKLCPNTFVRRQGAERSLQLSDGHLEPTHEDAEVLATLCIEQGQDL